MQSALVAGGAVPLATGAAAAGSIFVTFLQGGINALNALSTSLTDVASAVSNFLPALIRTFKSPHITVHYWPPQLGSLLLRRLPARRLRLSRKSRLPLLQPCRRLSPWATPSKQTSQAQAPALKRSRPLLQDAPEVCPPLH